MYKRLLISAVLLCGCAAFYPTPPGSAPLDGFALHRFDRVDAQVYRSGQPSAKELAALTARYGIRAVLKLNHGSDALPPGVAAFHHPLDVLTEPTESQLQAVLQTLEQSPKPVLIHCTHGEDRTGLVVALYRMRHGTSTEVAYADMMQHGFHPYPGVWRAWLRSAGWLR